MKKHADVRLSAVGRNEDFERVQRLADDLRHVKERWDNRLVLENSPLWEGYFNGNFEIVLFGDTSKWSGVKGLWFVRVPAHLEAADRYVAKLDVLSLDLPKGDNGDEIIMFVLVAQAGGGPEVKVPIPARFYFFSNERRRIGEGLLYRCEGLGCFKVFSFLRKGEVKLLGGANAERRSVHPKFKAFPKVVDGVARDCAKMLRDRLFGKVGDPITIRLSKERYAPTRHPQIIYPAGQDILIGDKLVNVALGPFDL